MRPILIFALLAVGLAIQPASRADVPTITIVDSDKAVEARLGQQPLLRYNKAHVEPPEGVNPKVGRSAHIHPVWTPGGAIVTDELPPDHLHQSGIFLAFTKTIFEGREVDFWNLGGGKGRVRFQELKQIARMTKVDSVRAGPRCFGLLEIRRHRTCRRVSSFHNIPANAGSTPL